MELKNAPPMMPVNAIATTSSTPARIKAVSISRPSASAISQPTMTVIVASKNATRDPPQIKAVNEFERSSGSFPTINRRADHANRFQIR